MSPGYNYEREKRIAEAQLIELAGRVRSLAPASGSPLFVMKAYIYIRAEVTATDPGLATITNALTEKVTGEAVPDVMPPVHPGSISFRHCRLMASSVEHAYALGWPLLGDPPEDAVCNDYVVPLDEANR